MKSKLGTRIKKLAFKCQKSKSKEQIHFRARMGFPFDVARKTLVSLLQNISAGDAAWIGVEKKTWKREGK